MLDIIFIYVDFQWSFGSFGEAAAASVPAAGAVTLDLTRSGGPPIARRVWAGGDSHARPVVAAHAVTGQVGPCASSAEAAGGHATRRGAAGRIRPDGCTPCGRAVTTGRPLRDDLGPPRRPRPGCHHRPPPPRPWRAAL